MTVVVFGKKITFANHILSFDEKDLTNLQITLHNYPLKVLGAKYRSLGVKGFFSPNNFVQPQKPFSLSLLGTIGNGIKKLDLVTLKGTLISLWHIRIGISFDGTKEIFCVGGALYPLI